MGGGGVWGISNYKKKKKKKLGYFKKKKYFERCRYCQDIVWRRYCQDTP